MIVLLASAAVLLAVGLFPVRQSPSNQSPSPLASQPSRKPARPVFNKVSNKDLLRGVKLRWREENTAGSFDKHEAFELLVGMKSAGVPQEEIESVVKALLGFCMDPHSSVVWPYTVEEYALLLSYLDSGRDKSNARSFLFDQYAEKEDVPLLVKQLSGITDDRELASCLDTMLGRFFKEPDEETLEEAGRIVGGLGLNERDSASAMDSYRMMIQSVLERSPDNSRKLPIAVLREVFENDDHFAPLCESSATMAWTAGDLAAFDTALDAYPFPDVRSRLVRSAADHAESLDEDAATMLGARIPLNDEERPQALQSVIEKLRRTIGDAKTEEFIRARLSAGDISKLKPAG